jgi:hypothetical protein
MTHGEALLAVGSCSNAGLDGIPGRGLRPIQVCSVADPSSRVAVCHAIERRVAALDAAPLPDGLALARHALRDVVGDERVPRRRRLRRTPRGLGTDHQRVVHARSSAAIVGSFDNGRLRIEVHDDDPTRPQMCIWVRTSGPGSESSCRSLAGSARGSTGSAHAHRLDVADQPLVALVDRAVGIEVGTRPVEDQQPGDVSKRGLLSMYKKLASMPVSCFISFRQSRRRERHRRRPSGPTRMERATGGGKNAQITVRELRARIGGRPPRRARFAGRSRTPHTYTHTHRSGETARPRMSSGTRWPGVDRRDRARAAILVRFVPLCWDDVTARATCRDRRSQSL